MLREKWVFNVAINTHYKWSQLHYINKTLQEKEEYNAVKQAMEHKLWFVIGKTKGRISKLEFYLITILKFGPMLDELLDTFREGNFQRPSDATRMAFVLIAKNILFDQEYRRRVTPWLLSLVEDIDAWNAFPWGHYVWRLTEDYLLKGFEVPDSNSQKATRLRYNMYGFAWSDNVTFDSQFWAMEAISAFQKIVTPYAPKDVYPRMCRWQCNQKPKGFYKTVEQLESSEQLWVVKTLEPTPDEAIREYFMDIDVPLSEGHQYLDHTTTTLQPLTSPPQTHTTNEPSLTHLTRVNDGVVTKRQLRRIMHRHKKDMSELKASIQSLTLAMQTFEDRVVAHILEGLKSQLTDFPIYLVLYGGPSSHNVGDDNDDADDGQHDEATVHINDDVVGRDGDDAMAGDVTLQSDDAERVHVPQVDSVIDASAGGEGDLHSFVAEGVHDF
ncbi:Uncharacterized protein TCM_035241 [Theobroma cacao]|uniref:DUF1985 domain-containing protein n=1 Tax=Theobroma cacao TaxID=3641 RepID=A0A061FPL3_THECC|nr:Uncharacterized protein TCM_035241 [Theobroma cacao]